MGRPHHYIESALVGDVRWYKTPYRYSFHTVFQVTHDICRKQKFEQLLYWTRVWGYLVIKPFYDELLVGGLHGLRAIFSKIALCRVELLSLLGWRVTLVNIQ